MTCRCSERRAAIVRAARDPSQALTSVKFVAKTSVQDIAVVTKTTTGKVLKVFRLKRA